MSNTKEFFDLLNSIADEQTFSLELCPRDASNTFTVSCKPLTTAQLRSLIETVVDSPLTQASFNTTATKVFKQSLVKEPGSPLNVVDRLLFLLESRCQSLSPQTTMSNDGEAFEVNFQDISNKLKQSLKDNASLFLPTSFTEGKLTVNVSVALLDADLQLNEEIYKDLNPNVDDAEELRGILGSAFINEIAKSILSIEIEDNVLDLASVTFESRLQAVGALPASLIQKVIEYIESYKKIVDEHLTVNGNVIILDGSLFSLR